MLGGLRRSIALFLLVAIISSALLFASVIPALTYKGSVGVQRVPEFEATIWTPSVAGWWAHDYAQLFGYSACTYLWSDGSDGLPAFIWDNINYYAIANTSDSFWYINAHGAYSGAYHPYFVTQTGDIISAIWVWQHMNHWIPFVMMWHCNAFTGNTEWSQVLSIPYWPYGWNSHSSLTSFSEYLPVAYTWYFCYGFWVGLASPGWVMGNAWDNGQANVAAQGGSYPGLNAYLWMGGDRNWDGRCLW